MQRTVFIYAFILLVLSTRTTRANDWISVPIPGPWEETGPESIANYDGFAWYRAQVRIPANWKGEKVELLVQGVDNACEVYLDGFKIGAIGSLPPMYANGVDEIQRFVIPEDRKRPGDLHWLAFRIYDEGGRGGFKAAPPLLTTGKEAVPLRGGWEFRTGDDLAWAKPDKAALPEGRPFEDHIKAESIVRWMTTHLSAGGAMPAEESVKHFVLPDDLAIDLVLAEPTIEQPVFLNFDERGRLWVVEYRQYPHPAGLKMLSRDRFWRAVYDKVPQPPPNHVKGLDRVSIHEDADGDGKFESSKVFVDGLNIATAVEFGRGGVWVLNPPYLLFYPDANHDDVPDGDPVVHLGGFGLQDTHSVANSLTWGPDGWLYGAQGSTVTASIIRPGIDKKPIESMGQLIWRYHPETKRYEIFAEGGGNTFGVEFDSKGRVFSGHNGGDTRGFHYVQGGYYQKGFSKHGPLSNPYAFGYYPQMPSPPVPRFTHTFLIYEGCSLPDRYHGILFGVAPLQSNVVASQMIPFGSTFRTQDIDPPVTTDDGYFKPVDIKTGPDGAIYVADWYDFNVNHYRNHEGNIDPKSGRVYRLRAKRGRAEQRGLAPRLSRGQVKNDATGEVPVPFASEMPTASLTEQLQSCNEWDRRTVQRLLADRKDVSILPTLFEMLRQTNEQTALEALWAIHGVGAWSEDLALEAMGHPSPDVRRWAVRFVGDDRLATPRIVKRIIQLAMEETSVETRTQIASTARRFETDAALPILKELIRRDEDAEDPYQPLLIWWGLESKIAQGAPAVMALFDDESLWRTPMAERHLLDRLMRRFASTGSRQDLLVCAKLLQQAPGDAERKRLVAGFEQAFAGRSLADVPPELATALAEFGGASIALGLRLGRADAVQGAIAILSDPKKDAEAKRQIADILAEVDQPSAVPALLAILEGKPDDALLASTLTALAHYPTKEVGSALLAFAGRQQGERRLLAQTALAGRAEWAKSLVDEVDSKSMNKEDVPTSVVARMLLHRDESLAKRVKAHWGDVRGATSAEAQAKIDAVRKWVSAGEGTPYEGYKLFGERCGKCHKLFEAGGQVGPDLTSYKRTDIDNMLLAVVNPSAEVREGYETYLIYTTDGQALTGFIADQDAQVVVIKTAEGQSHRIAREEIDEMEKASKSVMPDGLLDGLTEQQVKDLFAYLKSSQPLNQ